MVMDNRNYLIEFDCSMQSLDRDIRKDEVIDWQQKGELVVTQTAKITIHAITTAAFLVYDLPFHRVRNPCCPRVLEIW